MTNATTKNRLSHVLPTAISELDSFVDHFLGPNGIRYATSGRNSTCPVSRKTTWN